jgi:hypothetical protein
MIVTKFHYPMEAQLVKRLDLMIARCIQPNPKRDAVILNEGAEGEGKTSLSVAEAFYVAEKTGRTFTHNNIFFDIDKMIKFLQNNEGQIAIWDEPALQALSGDALSTLVKNLKRMLMMCRNKRHFIIINMTYFTEFGGYIVWQRPLCMIHVYSRNELQAGRFIYIRKKNLERLWLDWRTKKQRNYKKWGSKICRGTFPDVLNSEYKNNVLSEFDVNAYERNKHNAIASIGMVGEKKLTPTEIRRDVMLDLIRKNEEARDRLTDKQMYTMMRIHPATFYRYKQHLSNPSKSRFATNTTMGEKWSSGTQDTEKQAFQQETEVGYNEPERMDTEA